MRTLVASGESVTRIRRYYYGMYMLVVILWLWFRSHGAGRILSRLGWAAELLGLRHELARSSVVHIESGTELSG